MIMLQDGSIAYYTGKLYNIFNNKPDYSWLIITDKQSNVSHKGLHLPVIKNSKYVLYQSFPRYKDEVYFKHPYADTIYKINPQGPHVNHLRNYLIAADDIEYGSDKRVPLWMFGFLY